MAAPKKSIELLPKEDWERSSLGKILKWALTVGRHIVIFTELIVILAFLSRFKLDRDLTDITEEVKQKQAIVISSNVFEKDFRFVQNQLNTIESLRKNQLAPGSILDTLSACLSPDVRLIDFTVAGNQVSLNAVTLSETGLATFIQNLKSSGKFENLTLSQIQYGKEKEIGIKFLLKSELAKKNGT